MPVCVSRSLRRPLSASRDAEVRHHRVALGEQDVLRLDVAVHDAVAVRVVERVGHLARDAERLVDRQLPLAVEPVAERSRPRRSGMT